MQDSAELSGLVEEVNAIARDVGDPVQVQALALQLFQCAPCLV